MFNWQALSSNLGIIFLIIWEAFWKGIALWKAAKRGDVKWFIPIFLINLFGIIPLIYLWRTKQLDVVLQDLKSFFKKLPVFGKR